MQKEDEILLAHIKTAYEKKEQEILSKWPNRLTALVAPAEKQSESDVRAETALILAGILSDEKADLIPLAQHGEKFPPKRPLGSISTKTKYIRQLALANPDKSAKELLRIADRNIIGIMKDDTFRNKVSQARNAKQ